MELVEIVTLQEVGKVLGDWEDTAMVVRGGDTEVGMLGVVTTGGSSSSSESNDVIS